MGGSDSAEGCAPKLYEAAGGVTDGAMHAIDLSAADNVWAVGGEPYFDEKSSLALHWDGRTWSRIESPPDVWHYEDVAVIDSGDVWAVGRTGHSFGKAHVSHWDGEAWSEPPFPAADEAHTVSVDGSAGDDVWVGGALAGPFDAPKPYLAHWDGQVWTAVELKHRVPAGVVNGLSAVAPDDVWGIVEVEGRKGGFLPSLLIHWDGREWATVPGPGQLDLSEVTATAPNNLWVASRTPTLHHWNGRRWKEVGLPFSDLHIQGLDQAGASLWVVASDQGPEVIARYDGSTWSQATLPAETLTPDYRGIAAVSSVAAWTVGQRYPEPRLEHAPTPSTQLSCIDP